MAKSARKSQAPAPVAAVVVDAPVAVVEPTTSFAVVVVEPTAPAVESAPAVVDAPAVESAPAVVDAPVAKPAKTKLQPHERAIATMVVNGKEYTYSCKGTTSSGNAAYDNGDATAARLRGLSLDVVFRVCAAELLRVHGTDQKGEFRGCTDADSLVAVLESGLTNSNVGRQRMTLGNRIRSLSKKPTWKPVVAEKLAA